MSTIKERVGSGRVRWVFPLTLGAAITATVGTLVIHAKQVEVPKAEAIRALHMGRDPQTYYDLQKLISKADSTEYITEADYTRVFTLVQSKNTLDRVDALRVLTFVTDGPHQRDIASVARNLINDPSGPVQMQALRLLRLCHEPDWKSLAENRLNSPLEEVRLTAMSIIKRGEYVRKAKTP